MINQKTNKKSEILIRKALAVILTGVFLFTNTLSWAKEERLFSTAIENKFFSSRSANNSKLAPKLLLSDADKQAEFQAVLICETIEKRAISNYGKPLYLDDIFLWKNSTEKEFEGCRFEHLSNELRIYLPKSSIAVRYFDPRLVQETPAFSDLSKETLTTQINAHLSRQIIHTIMVLPYIEESQSLRKGYKIYLFAYLDRFKERLRGAKKRLNIMESGRAPRSLIDDAIRVVKQNEDALEKARAQVAGLQKRMKDKNVSEFIKAVRAEASERLSAQENAVLSLFSRVAKNFPGLNFNSDDVIFCSNSSWICDLFSLHNTEGVLVNIPDRKNNVNLIFILPNQLYSPSKNLDYIKLIIHESCHKQYVAGGNIIAKSYPNLRELFSIFVEPIVDERALKDFHDVLEFMAADSTRDLISAENWAVYRDMPDEFFSYYSSYDEEKDLIQAMKNVWGREEVEKNIERFLEGDPSGLQNLFGSLWNTVLIYTNKFEELGRPVRSLGVGIMAHSLVGSAETMSQRLHFGLTILDTFINARIIIPLEQTIHSDEDRRQLAACEYYAAIRVFAELTKSGTACDKTEVEEAFVKHTTASFEEYKRHGKDPLEKLMGSGMIPKDLTEYARRSATTAEDLVSYIRRTGLYYQTDIIRQALLDDSAHDPTQLAKGNPAKLARFEELLALASLPTAQTDESNENALSRRAFLGRIAQLYASLSNVGNIAGAICKQEMTLSSADAIRDFHELIDYMAVPTKSLPTMNDSISSFAQDAEHYEVTSTSPHWIITRYGKNWKDIESHAATTLSQVKGELSKISLYLGRLENKSCAPSDIKEVIDYLNSAISDEVKVWSPPPASQSALDTIDLSLVPDSVLPSVSQSAGDAIGLSLRQDSYLPKEVQDDKAKREAYIGERVQLLKRLQNLVSTRMAGVNLQNQRSVLITGLRQKAVSIQNLLRSSTGLLSRLQKRITSINAQFEQAQPELAMVINNGIPPEIVSEESPETVSKESQEGIFGEPAGRRSALDAFRDLPALEETGAFKGFVTFIEANKDLISTLLVDTDNKILFRVSQERIKAGELDSSFDGLIAALQKTPNGYVEIFSEKGDVIEEWYAKLVTKKLPDGFERTKENTITLFTVLKDEISPNEVDAKKELFKLLRIRLGAISLEKTQIVPIGLQDDPAGLIRNIFMGLRLIHIARQNKELGKVDEDFAKETVKQYKDLCDAQGVEGFNLTTQDVVDIAIGKVNNLIHALNKLIRLLPIKPIDIETLRRIYDYTKVVITAA